jgi:hypothetical protein
MESNKNPKWNELENTGKNLILMRLCEALIQVCKDYKGSGLRGLVGKTQPNDDLAENTIKLLTSLKNSDMLPPYKTIVLQQLMMILRNELSERKSSTNKSTFIELLDKFMINKDGQPVSEQAKKNDVYMISQLPQDFFGKKYLQKNAETYQTLAGIIKYYITAGSEKEKKRIFEEESLFATPENQSPKVFPSQHENKNKPQKK